MRIINLQAENIKRLVAVDISPKDNLVQITGRNSQGKTCVLDCIWWALEGAKNIQTEPIRKGATEAFIRLKMGEGTTIKLIVTRSFSKKGNDTTTKLTITNADGMKIPCGGQAMLNGFLDALSLDPFEFKKMSPKEQFNLLKKFVPGVDFDKIADLNKADYEARTIVNRGIKTEEAVRDTIETTATADMKPVDTDALIDLMEKAGATNTDIEHRRGNRERMDEDAQRKRKEAAILISDAIKIQARLDDAPDLPLLVDVSDLRKKITEGKAHNEEVLKFMQKYDSTEKIIKLNQESDKLTDSMNNREKDKKAKIAAAKIPVKNIAFGDGIVLLDGVPFEQGSDAEQLRACISIAMAGDPELKVIRVRDGSLLDENSEQLIREMATAKGFDIWQEKVDSTGKIGFVIEDGRTLGAEEPKKTAAKEGRDF